MSKEGQPSGAERLGAGVRNVGLLIAALGLINMLVEVPLPVSNEKVVVGGGVLAASGEIFRRVVGKKKGNQ